VVNIEKLPEFDGHELILRFSDKFTGLRGFIAIHNTNAGPAVGGTRFAYYKNEEDALRDALRLSRAMTYKCALSHVPYGGGKTVLMAPRSPAMVTKLKNEKYLRAYARKLDFLKGSFFTGEDVGMTEHDIKTLARFSTSIIGRPSVGELPSYWAALSVFESMRVALKTTFGNESFVDRTVAIKGLGNVGFDLAQMLHKAGAHIVAADTNKERVLHALKHLPNIRIVSAGSIHTQKADIFSPCALGGDLTKKVIAEIKAKIVCGSANNQLATPEDGMRLLKRGIIYVPDYIANAGGLINVVDELHSGGYDRKRVQRNTIKVGMTVAHVLSESKRLRRPSNKVADKLGRERFEA